MKKSINVLLAIGVLVFLACGSDDDNNVQQDCQICSFGFDAEVEEATFCDNGDGTVTVKANGEETTESLEGSSFNDFIDALEFFGGDCNKQ